MSKSGWIFVFRQALSSFQPQPKLVAASFWLLLILFSVFQPRSAQAEKPDHDLALRAKDALARRFKADLTVAQAAAEAGLEPQDFQARVRSSSRLTSLGFGQLLVAGGGFKRDVWERHFGDLVQELHLGDFVSGGRIIQPDPRGVAAVNVPDRGVQNGAPGELLRSAQTVSVSSKTQFFKPDLLEIELQKRPEFQAARLVVVKDRRKADLAIEVDRPIFTFTYTFTVTDSKTSVVVAGGKIDAADENEAAPILAREFVKQTQLNVSANALLPAASNALNSDPTEIIRAAKTVFITTKTQFFKPDLLEIELNKRSDFQALQLLVVKDKKAADLIVEIDRPIFTFTYTFTATNPKTGMVVAGGSLDAFDENEAAPKLADELMRRVVKVRPVELKEKARAN